MFKTFDLAQAQHGVSYMLRKKLTKVIGMRNASRKLKQIYIEILLALLNPTLVVRAISGEDTHADAKRKK